MRAPWPSRSVVDRAGQQLEKPVRRRRRPDASQRMVGPSQPCRRPVRQRRAACCDCPCVCGSVQQRLLAVLAGVTSAWQSQGDVAGQQPVARPLEVAQEHSTAVQSQSATWRGVTPRCWRRCGVVTTSAERHQVVQPRSGEKRCTRDDQGGSAEIQGGRRLGVVEAHCHAMCAASVDVDGGVASYVA